MEITLPLVLFSFDTIYPFEELYNILLSFQWFHLMSLIQSLIEIITAKICSPKKGFLFFVYLMSAEEALRILRAFSFATLRYFWTIDVKNAKNAVRSEAKMRSEASLQKRSNLEESSMMIGG